MQLIHFGILLQLGCAPSDPLRWELEDNLPLATLVGSSDPVALLVVAPDLDGVLGACDNIMAHWLHWRDETSERVYILLSRPASHQERRTLLGLGIRQDAVLARGSRITHTPIEIVLHRDNVVYFGSGVRGSSALRDQLAGRTIREFVASRTKT